MAAPTGGLGAVLKGRDVDLGRDLAVKVLLEAHRDDPELVRRFVEEAQIGGQLQHPGVVPVYELGTFADRRPFFTMKLVKGRTLAALLGERTDPADDRPRFLAIFEQVCQTMAYAHARGVIHRDLKPSNVMVGAFGEVQVMDWGLAKVLPEEARADEAERAGDSPTRRVTRRHGAAAPAAGRSRRRAACWARRRTWPPEQARGEVRPVDERADVFGLGAILCEILTGQPPYRRADSAEEVRAQGGAGRPGGDLGPARRVRGRRGVGGAGRACLARGTDRLKDAQAVADGLTAYLAGVQERLRGGQLEQAAAEQRAAAERQARRLTVGLAAALLLLVVGGGGGGAWWAQHQREVREAEEAQRRQAADGEVARAMGDARYCWPGAGGPVGRRRQVSRSESRRRRKRRSWPARVRRPRTRTGRRWNWSR